MLSQRDFQVILERIEYQRPGRETWSLVVNRGYDDRLYLQVHSDGGEIFWVGRKWFLSPYMCVSEFVRTAFKAIQAAEEHEMCEHFKYKQVAIFTPHINVDMLVNMANADGQPNPEFVDTRDERTAKL